MCGIVGLVRGDVGGIDREAMGRMCARLTHRGPDDEGYYFGDGVALGMRRLAIIDVEAGRQPIHNEDRSIWVVFNGEIYNYQELRDDLERRNHKFSTSSDTECLVHLYEDFGDECVRYLRGMFCFAIWDDRSKRLLLARDRLGIKPLYYWQDGEDLAFASEMKSLLTLDGLARRINLEALSGFLTFGYVPGPITIYDGVYELPPAHIGIWSKGKLQLRRYWEIRPEPDANKPIEYFIEGLRHHLKEVVRLHLVSDVPLGAFLSGGIDSSAIVALMAQASERQIKTFTVGFEGVQHGFDERPFARTVAETFGTDHTESLLTPRVESILPDIVRSFDEPFADSSVIPNYLICQEARKLVTVALSGLGGDELFAGYERYRGALLAGYCRRLPRWFRRGFIDHVIHWVPQSRNGGLWEDRLRRFIRGTELDLADRYQHYIAVYDEDQKADIISQDLLRELDRRGLRSTRLVMKDGDGVVDPIDRMLLADMCSYLPHDELRKTDRLSMCHSLEVRVPLLDHKLVEFVATIPARYKLYGWQKKHILLRALAGTLPRVILTRRKQGFSVPLDRWLRGPLRELMHTYLSEPVVRRLGLFNSRTVGRILEEHEQGHRNHESRIWALLMFMLWHDLYMRKEPREDGRGARVQATGR